jgi:hypothetical protein
MSFSAFPRTNPGNQSPAGSVSPPIAFRPTGGGGADLCKWVRLCYPVCIPVPMDPEIARLVRLRRFLRGNLRRASSGCLEYVGPKRGSIAGNPLLCIRVRGRTSVMLLRRWIWELHRKKSPPPGKFIFMKCRNGSCHEFTHMAVSGRLTFYRNNSLLAHPERFRERKIRIIRYFKGRIGARMLAGWFGVTLPQVYRIWNGEIRPEVRLPADFSPPPEWQARAELASFHARTGHYLSEKNRKMALEDIRASDLPPYAKERLSLYAQGIPLPDIARRLHRSRETILDCIELYLPRLEKQLPDRKWLRLLLKKK